MKKISGVRNPDRNKKVVCLTGKITRGSPRENHFPPSLLQTTEQMETQVIATPICVALHFLDDVQRLHYRVDKI